MKFKILVLKYNFNRSWSFIILDKIRNIKVLRTIFTQTFLSILIVYLIIHFAKYFKANKKIIIKVPGIKPTGIPRILISSTENLVWLELGNFILHFYNIYRAIVNQVFLAHCEMDMKICVTNYSKLHYHQIVWKLT